LSSVSRLLQIRRPRSIRPFLIVAGVLACASALTIWLQLGRFLAPQDPLATADAIFVFAGTRVERPLEAADLYLAGYAPSIVITRAAAEQGAVALARTRGVDVPTEFDAAHTLLLGLGAPPDAVITPARAHDNTGEEARTLRELARARGWRRVIVVSSTYHLRRVALATRRALRGTDVEVIIRGTRYDPSEPERWWRHRADIRWLASEVPKLAAYALGIGG
jgi:uncharacterized SAM-binding protein YcdF (DUF218 family)